jgi:hypothetical protein
MELSLKILCWTILVVNRLNFPAKGYLEIISFKKLLPFISDLTYWRPVLATMKFKSLNKNHTDIISMAV